MRKKRVSKSVALNLPLYKGEDYTDRIIGNRRVVSFHSYTSRGSSGSYLWNCECLSCGNVSAVASNTLLYGRANSCSSCENKGRAAGRSLNPNWKGFGKIPGTVLQRIRMSCRTRARLLECDIDCEYLDWLWDKQEGRCFYSGREIFLGHGPNSSGGNASVDRTDSSKGYIRGNVQWVDVNINRAKWEMTPEELVQMCRDVVAFQVQAPFEEITEKEYNQRVANSRVITSASSVEFEAGEDCASGACPIK